MNSNSYLPSFRCPGCGRERVITTRCSELTMPREVMDTSIWTYIVCGACLSQKLSEEPKVRARIEATIIKNLNAALTAARKQEHEEKAAEQERLRFVEVQYQKRREADGKQRELRKQKEDRKRADRERKRKDENEKMRLGVLSTAWRYAPRNTPPPSLEDLK